MKRLVSLVSLLGATIYLNSVPLSAQGRGRGGTGMGQVGRPASEPRANSPRPDRAPATKGHERSAHAGGESSVSNKLADNTRLTSKMESLLPPGTNVPDAANGFKNLGQFVAAVHVSHNLNIPFDQLKQDVIAKGSLGKAVHALKPDLSKKQLKEATEAAEKEAKQDVENSAGKTAEAEQEASSKTQR